MALFKSATKRSLVGPSEELVQEFHSTKSSPLGLSFHTKFDIYFVNLFYKSLAPSLLKASG